MRAENVIYDAFTSADVFTSASGCESRVASDVQPSAPGQRAFPSRARHLGSARGYVHTISVRLRLRRTRHPGVGQLRRFFVLRVPRVVAPSAKMFIEELEAEGEAELDYRGRGDRLTWGPSCFRQVLRANSISQFLFLSPPPSLIILSLIPLPPPMDYPSSSLSLPPLLLLIIARHSPLPRRPRTRRQRKLSRVRGGGGSWGGGESPR